MKEKIFEFYRALSWLFKRDLLKLVRKCEGNVLDIGGDRFFGKKVSSEKLKYTAINNSYQDEGSYKYDAEIYGNAMDMPIDDNTFDHVWCFQVLEHVNEPQLLVNESYRVLKTGGKAIFSVPQNNILHEAPHNYFYFTAFGIRHLFEKAGFKRISIDPKGGYWTTNAYRYFDYIMLFLDSIGLVSLGFGYNIFAKKNIVQKITICISIIPASILFILALIMMFIFKFSDIKEDPVGFYVFAEK